MLYVKQLKEMINDFKEVELCLSTFKIFIHPDAKLFCIIIFLPFAA